MVAELVGEDIRLREITGGAEAVGTTVFDAAEEAPVPALLVAATVNV